jgi:NAD-dependent dihydropyrimidine dehydrogenase PreA subunit
MMAFIIWWSLLKWERRSDKVMIHKINEKFITCGCYEVTCSVSVINEGHPIYAISKECVECGACAAVCPIGAILAP